MPIVDARGRTCPEPVVMTMRELDALASSGRTAEPVEVLVDDEVAVENLRRLGASHSRSVVVLSEDAGSWRVSLVADGPAPAAGAVAPPVPDPSPDALAGRVVIVGGSSLGRGDDELGAILMRGLIYALANNDLVPATMVFLNGGAPLTCEGSASLDDIRQLEERGCSVLTCGTCLDHLGLKDRLAVGGVTNLYAIAQLLLSPGGVVEL
ncbi:MAG: sulfurtransferase-like selenium metabolism protein YedF [Collinsella sp.]|nr:sulfurtransferase-like selenium metabolism protein YedF [Collinsella sp.]